MSEFNIEDLDAVIARSREGSLAQMLALQLKGQIRKGEKLAAENVAIREQSEEVYAAGYNHGHLNTVDGIAYAGCVKDDFYGLALQVMAEVETPATDAYLVGIKADGVEEFAKHCDDSIGFVEPEDEELYTLMEEQARDFAKQLRDGADK